MPAYDAAVAYDGAIPYDSAEIFVAQAGAASGRRRTAQEFRAAYYREEPDWKKIEAKRKERLERFLQGRNDLPVEEPPRIFMAEEKMRPIAMVFEDINLTPNHFELELLLLSQWI